MKTFFDYFKGREAVEKTGNRVANSEKSPSASSSMKDESSAFQPGSRPSDKSLGQNISLSQKPPNCGREVKEEQAIILKLEDFLKRIPPEFLRPGGYQPARELHFGIDEVANNIAQGKATILLSEIAKQCPEIFKDSIVGRKNIDIFFPWHKLARQVDFLRSYRSRTKPDAEKLEALSAKQENAPLWDSKLGTEAIPVKQEPQAVAPLCSNSPEPCKGHLKAGGLESSEQVESTAQKTRSTGVGEAGLLKTQMAELKAEREKMLAEVANARSELGRVRNEAAQLSAVNASRERAERQVETLRSQFREANAAKKELDARLKKAEADIKSVEVLGRELEKAVEGRQHAVRELEIIRAEMQTLRETSAAARTELVVHAAEIEKAKGIAEARVRELEQHIVDLNSKFESLTLERDKSAGEAPRLRGHHAKLIASLKSERDNAFNSRDELREEMQRTREEFRKKVDTLTAERDALKREKLQFNSQKDQLRFNHKKQIDFLNGDTEKRVAAMNKRVEVANAEREKLVWDLKNQREQFNAQIEDLRFERIALIKARDEAIAQERETRRELEVDLEELKRGRDLRIKH